MTTSNLVNFLSVVSGQQTTGSTSADFDVPPGSPLEVVAVVTTSSGTLTVFRLWFQGSHDGGTTWVDLPFDLVLKTGQAAPGNASASTRDLINEAAVVASGQWYGLMNRPMRNMRAQWLITAPGGGIGETFSVLALGLG